MTTSPTVVPRYLLPSDEELARVQRELSQIAARPVYHEKPGRRMFVTPIGWSHETGKAVA